MLIGIRYLRSVTSPTSMAGEPGTLRVLPARAARDLIRRGYAEVPVAAPPPPSKRQSGKEKKQWQS